MRRKAKLFPTLILLTGAALWVAAVAGATSVQAVPASRLSPSVSAARTANGQGPARTTSAADVAHVSHVSVQQAEGGQATVIQVTTDRAPDYHVFQLSNPSRLVVDLKDARNDSNQWKVASNSPYLKDVRLGRFNTQDGIIRVVADLSGSPAFDVHASPGGIQIELRSRQMAINHSGSTTKEAASAPLQTQIIRDVPASHGPITEQSTKTELAKDSTATVTPIAHPDYQNALPKAGLTSANVATIKADQPAGPNPQALAARAAANIIKMSIPAATTFPGQAGGQQTPKYTGEPISLNLKNVDLKDFFRLIHEISGLNILVDPDVSGSVTMVLDSVPWDQALDIVLKDNGLGKQLEGNVLRIAKLSTLQAEQEEAKKLAAAKIDNEPLVTVFRPVNYAKASTIAAMLKGWVGGGALSSRGSVLVDDRTNTLIISDVQERIPLIEGVIAKLDEKSAQISIEARIIRVTTDFARNISSALSAASIGGTAVQAGATGAPAVSGTTTVPPTVSTGTASGFGVFVIGATNSALTRSINAAIAAAETHDEAKIISRPSVVTQNNVQARVIQGTQIPVQTTINNTISVTFVQASLQLQVTPQVTNDGNVFLTIEITNNSPGPALTAVAPTINTQSATTEVLVPNGGTVVFGGVTVTQRSKSVTQVPLLGSIPIVGQLFKNSVTTSNDQELLFFVTPRILKS